MICEVSECPFDFAQGRLALGEECVVILAAVKRRVEVDEIDRLLFDVLTQDFEVIAVIKLILFHCGVVLTRMGAQRNLIVWYAGGNSMMGRVRANG